MFYFVVGNKDDCPEKKVVVTEDAQNFSEQIGIRLFETSAKENINVEAVKQTSFSTRNTVKLLLSGHPWGIG